MATLVTAGLAITYIGTDIYLKTISYTCSKAVDTATFFVVGGYPGLTELNDTLNKTDLITKINIVNKLINDLQKMNEDDYDCQYLNETIKLSIGSVTKVIEKIDKALEEIRKMKTTHGEKWFSSWRKCDCKDQIKIVKEQNVILNDRLDFLLKIIAMQQGINEK